jgi:hypothetical protein
MPNSIRGTSKKTDDELPYIDIEVEIDVLAFALLRRKLGL